MLIILCWYFGGESIEISRFFWTFVGAHGKIFPLNLGARLMARLRSLEPSIEVRILCPQYK